MDYMFTRTGRPREYENNAEKQRAYRQRKKALRNTAVPNSVAKFNALLAELEKHGTSLSVWYKGNNREGFLRRKIELSRELLALYDTQPDMLYRDYHMRNPLAPDEYPRHYLLCSLSLGEWLLTH